MLKIGDFSRLSRVSIKALRYYDQIGLLKPTHIDPFTSYRYYSVDQLPRLNRILALKDLGFNLNQITRLLEERLPPEQIRGMLRMRQVEIENQLQEEQARLFRVEARLRQIEQEDRMSEYDVIIKTVEPQRVVSIRDIVEDYGAQGRLWQEIEGFLTGNSIRAAGPSITIYYDTEYKERDVDLEAATPITANSQGNSRFQVKEIPGGEMACTVHHGDYEGLSQAYTALIGWIEANGYRIVGPNREIYLQCGDNGYSDPAVFGDSVVDSVEDFLTEIQFPVEKV
jgi:effector-binding domain-containing protein